MTEAQDTVNSIIDKSDAEFTDQQNLAAKRIDHLFLLQDRLRNHISNIESINQLLEQKANTSTGEDRIRTLKSLSFNYDRLIKLYEVYQSYETAVQRYHVHVVDTINKKYQVNLNAVKNIKEQKESLDFYRNLHKFLSNKTPDEIHEIARIDDPAYDL